MQVIFRDRGEGRKQVRGDRKHLFWEKTELMELFNLEVQGDAAVIFT